MIQDIITDLSPIGHTSKRISNLSTQHLQQGVAMPQRRKSTLRSLVLIVRLSAACFGMMCLPECGVTAMAAAATKLPPVDAALAAQVSDQAHRDWNPDAELIQITVTAAADGSADGAVSSTPVTFLFRVDSRGYQMTLSRDGNILGARAPLPPNATEALPITFIGLKDALALARAKGFSQTGNLHPVLQSFVSTDGLRKIGWLFAAPGDPLDKQIFVTADGHQVGSVQRLFGSLRQ